jgi:hypothetical protein
MVSAVILIFCPVNPFGKGCREGSPPVPLVPFRFFALARIFCAFFFTLHNINRVGVTRLKHKTQHQLDSRKHCTVHAIFLIVIFCQLLPAYFLFLFCACKLARVHVIFLFISP